MDYQLVEPFCGSSAFTLHMLGAKAPLVPYQGTKWRFRKQLEGLANFLGFWGPPAGVTLTDAGPWSHAMSSILFARERRETIRHLGALALEDPHDVYLRLINEDVSPTITDGLFSAKFLFLQRLSFSGKAVGRINNRWVSPGFNKTSAYGTPGTARFGAVSPMVPSLIRRLEAYDQDLTPVSGWFAHHVVWPEAEQRTRKTLVYIDPPYQGSTPYPNGTCTRGQVIEYALAWADFGAAVMISEAEPLSDLITAGWSKTRISQDRNGASPFRSKKEEWVTYIAGKQ